MVISSMYLLIYIINNNNNKIMTGCFATKLVRLFYDLQIHQNQNNNILRYIVRKEEDKLTN